MTSADSSTWSANCRRRAEFCQRARSGVWRSKRRAWVGNTLGVFSYYYLHSLLIAGARVSRSFVMNRCFCTLVALALVAVGIGSAGAQTRATTADLSGIVYDQSKAVLPGAILT